MSDEIIYTFRGPKPSTPKPQKPQPNQDTVPKSLGKSNREHKPQQFDIRRKFLTISETQHQGNLERDHSDSSPEKSSMVDVDISSSSSNDPNECLDEQIRKRKEKILSYKVGELQRICSTLTAANRNLLDKVEFLEAQRNGNYNSELQKSRDSCFQAISPEITDSSNIQKQREIELQTELAEVQDRVHEYRKHLQETQVKISEELFEKDRFNQKLKEEIHRLQAKIIVIQKRYEQIELKNSIFMAKNQQLESQLQNHTKRGKNRSADKVQTTKMNKFQISVGSPLSKSYIMPEEKEDLTRQIQENDDDFQTVINSQLEYLVQKLVDQLQAQRKTKKQMMVEIKRLGKDLMETEREVKSKNNKIYNLDLILLKNDKKSMKCNRCNAVLVSPSSQNPIGTTERSEGSLPETITIPNSSHNRRQSNRELEKTRNKLYDTFTLMDLLNQDFKVSGIEKLYMIIKILDFYERKLQQKDFTHVLVEDLEIINFTRKNLSLLVVRDQSRLKRSFKLEGKYQLSRENLLWNMGFIMDNLLNQVPETPRDNTDFDSLDFEENKIELNQFVNLFIGNRKEIYNNNPFRKLKEFIQDVLT